MDSLDRVVRTIKFKCPDRFPIMHAVLPAAWMKYGTRLYSILKGYPTYVSKKFKAREEQASAGYEISEEFAREFNLYDDFVFIEPRTYQYGKLFQKGFQSDEWGCIWEKKDPGIVGQVVYHPLANSIINCFDEEVLSNYKFPDSDEMWRFDICLLKERKEYSKASAKYFLAYIGNLFELLQWLFGFENLLIGIKKGSKKIFKVMDKIINYNIKTMDIFSNYGIHGILMDDDWGTQRALMISPKIWRRYFKPAYKKIINEAKKRKLHFHFHTDGNVIEIIEDLIEIGVDVINPQLSAVNIEKLSNICKDKVCIITDIDKQYILPYASTIEVIDYVKKVIELFGTDKGGLILRGEINSDSKLENIKEMYESFEEFGKII